jgi:signal transduction histidine kinase
VSGARRGRWGVRTRLTVVATSVTAAALAVAGLLLVLGTRAALVGTLDQAGRQRGREVAGLVDAGTVPDPLPVTGAAVVQVLDEAGRVRASSPGGDRLTPLIGARALARVRRGDVVPLEGSRLGSREGFRLLGVRAGPGGGQTVLVASSSSVATRAVAVVAGATAVAVPALVLVVGLLVHRVSGSALRPVEQLRLGAAGVGPAPPDAPAAGRRPLPVPPSDDEVARLAVTLNDMLARLDEASVRERVFVADAAHELRSPLASLRTQLEVALAHPGAQDWARVAADGLVDVQRMSVLVDDLLLLARLGSAGDGAGAPGAADAGPAGPAGPVGPAGPAGPVRAVDLAALARDRAAAARRVPVVVDLPAAGDGRCLVHGSPRALERLLDNLLDNAARHAATRVVLSLRRRPDPDEVVLEVVDDGPGIEEADRERVFERFARLDAARDRDAGGAGLGLAIVRAVAQAAGGSVRATARPDGGPGARLVVRLPAAPAEPAGAGRGAAG